MAATLTQERFVDPAWTYERKYDGIRLLAFKRDGQVTLYSRNHIAQDVPAVAAAIAKLPAARLILDGELAWDRGAYHVFDVLWRDDRDLRASAARRDPRRQGRARGHPRSRDVTPRVRRHRRRARIRAGSPRRHGHATLFAMSGSGRTCRKRDRPDREDEVTVAVDGDAVRILRRGRVVRTLVGRDAEQARRALAAGDDEALRRLAH